MLNLEDRILEKNNNINNNIDYVYVKDKLDYEKKSSVKYLSSILR